LREKMTVPKNEERVDEKKAPFGAWYYRIGKGGQAPLGFR
jgi:hypothetical protein